MIPHAPSVGELGKVWVPGETPWAECVSVEPDGSWHGRIVNRLVGEMSAPDRATIGGEFFPGASPEPLPSLHDFKKDQIVRWVWRDDGTGARWMAAERAGGSA